MSGHVEDGRSRRLVDLPVTPVRQHAARYQPNPSDDERLVRKLASWCRNNRIGPMAEAAVPGPTETERRMLAALGGVAGALLEGAAPEQVERLPPAVVEWINAAPRLPSDLLDELRDGLQRGTDPLAHVYERLVAAPRRRPLGTFFTPASISTYMTDLVKSRVRRLVTIADPGAGVGAFTRSAIEAWPGAYVHAVDVNVATLGLLAATPAIAGAGPKRASLHHVDFLDWLSTEWQQTRGPRLIWGNPPYTRHQGMAPETKARARRAAGDLAPGGRAGLSTYFLAASLASLGPNDSLCLLLPANWLEAEYADTVRAHLWRATRRRTELHIFPPSLTLFPVASVSAMVIWIGPRTADHHPLLVRRLDGNVTDRFFPAQTESHARVGPVPANFMFAKRPTASKRSCEASVPLTSIAKIRRGVATGANHFFLLSDSEVKRLPQGTYVPAATRLREMPGDILDQATHEALGAVGRRRWLLWLDEGDADDPTISQLIDRGKFERVHEAHLCATRTPWYAVERIPVPDLLFGPMAKGRFRLIRNDIGAIPTNTFYGITLRRRPVAVDSIEELATWIRSQDGQRALFEVARQHGSGTLKVEPRDLAKLKVPAKIARGLDPA